MSKRQIDKETRIIMNYSGPVIKELMRLRDNMELSEVCRSKLRGLNVARLSEIINGTRKLTAFYLGILLEGGVVTLNQLLQGKKLEDLPKDHQDLLAKLTLCNRIASKLVKAINKKGEQAVEDILDILLS